MEVTLNFVVIKADSSLQIETVTSDGIWLINEVEGKAVVLQAM